MRIRVDSYKIKAFKRKLKFLALITNSLGLAMAPYKAQGFGLLDDWANYDLDESKSKLLEWDQGSSGNRTKKKKK